MKNFPLTIITPRGKIFEQDITSVVAPGADGLFGIMALHAPIVKFLGPGVVRITGHSVSFLVIDSGVLEVNENGNVLILADKGVAAASLTEAKEQVPSLVVK